MKVIGIISSPHANGNGAALVREALEGAAKRPASTREVFLPSLRIEFCRDCHACMTTGRCAVQDDFRSRNYCAKPTASSSARPRTLRPRAPG